MNSFRENTHTNRSNSADLAEKLNFSLLQQGHIYAFFLSKHRYMYCVCMHTCIYFERDTISGLLKIVDRFDQDISSDC